MRNSQLFPSAVLGLALSSVLLWPDGARALSDMDRAVVITASKPIAHTETRVRDNSYGSTGEPVVVHPNDRRDHDRGSDAYVRNEIGRENRREARDAAFDDRESARAVRREPRDRAYQERKYRREARRDLRNAPPDRNGDGTISHVERRVRDSRRDDGILGGLFNWR